MAFKELKPEVPVADPCSSLIFNNNYSKKVSGSSLSPSPSTTIRQKSCDLQRVFSYFDENGDGKISPSELRNCMQATGEELSSEEAEKAVHVSDSDGDGKLGLEDFAKLVEVKDEHEKDKTLMDAFQMYEMDGQGYITPKSLRRMLRRLGDDRTVEDCTAMIGRFDLNGDGVLNFEEFKIMMQ